MVDAFVKAVGQLLADRAMWKLFWLSVALAVVVFGLVWAGMWFLLNGTALFETAWLDTTIDWLGGLATLVLTWLLFPAGVSAMIAIFLEAAATAVERKHYPELPAAEGIGFLEGLGISLRFLAILIVLNLLLLLLLIVPPVFPIAFYLVNGYLIGREYLELVALRRVDGRRARELRRRHGVSVTVFGIIVTFLLTIPFVNLVAPLAATAAMVHLFVQWQARAA